MGEKIIALASKLGVEAESVQSEQTVSLARIYVPPHTRVSKGKTINVDGYWRDAGDMSQLVERERKAVANTKSLTNAAHGDTFSFLHNGSQVAHGTVMKDNGDSLDVQVRAGYKPFMTKMPRDTNVMSFRPGFGKVPEAPKLRESKPDGPLTEDDVANSLNDDRHLGYGYHAIGDVSEKKQGIANRAVAKAMTTAGFDKEDLFQWANSKFGRWYAEGILDGRPATELAKRIPDEVNQLKQEGYL